MLQYPGSTRCISAKQVLQIQGITRRRSFSIIIEIDIHRQSPAMPSTDPLGPVFEFSMAVVRCIGAGMAMEAYIDRFAGNSIPARPVGGIRYAAADVMVVQVRCDFVAKPGRMPEFDNMADIRPLFQGDDELKESVAVFVQCRRYLP